MSVRAFLSRSLRRPLLWPRLATVAALLAAVWPRIRSFWAQTKAEYDPTVALGCLTAIVVAWYTYFTYQTLDHTRQTAKAERDQHRDAINAQIGAIAFTLRRELREMLDHPDLKQPARIGYWAQRVTLGLPVTEDEMLQLMSLAPEASADRVTALREAYVTYYASADRINRLAKHPRPDPDPDAESNAWDWSQWGDDVKASLKECVEAVERLVSPALLQAERGVEPRRAAEDPLKALGHAIGEAIVPSQPVADPETEERGQ